MIMTLAGWDTGSSAPLLPFLQAYYKVRRAETRADE